jgi:HD-GYP domain-containing protein (c-di-GMP phosphodiesterase class II)
MKPIARIALKPGMILGEDVTDYKGNLLYSAGDVISDKDISRLARHNIVAVTVKEEVDFATTHFEKITFSDDYKHFVEVYNKCMPEYKDMMNALVEKGIPVRLDQLMKLYVSIASCAKTSEKLLDYLYVMLPSEDDMTHAHCLNSAIIAGVFAKWLCLSKEDTFILIESAFFYDIGKLKLPNDLIWKPSKLTDAEFAQIKQHTFYSFNILQSQKNINEHVLHAALMHHERCDGSGYPSHLKANQIDIFAKYIAIIDSYEAMTSPRTYRPSKNPFQVIEAYEKDGFIRFDESILRPILYHIASTQLGYTVRLSDGTEATVILVNEKCLSRPLCQAGPDIIDLSLRKDLTIEAIY